MFYYNQNNYSNVDYSKPNGTKVSVAKGGCGVCSAAMVLNNLAGKELYTIAAMAKFSKENKARDYSGTNMVTLLNALCKVNKGFSFKTTTDEAVLVKHLKSGGVAIANQGDVYNVFSTAGHFVVAYKMIGNNIEILDPQMYYGKYDSYKRPQRIVKKTEHGCIVSTAEINKATQDRNPAYYLVTYTKPATKTTSEKVSTNFKMYCNTTAGLRFRKEPSTSAELMKGADNGLSIIGYSDEVEAIAKVTNSEGSWYNIKYRGYVGFAFAKYLSQSKPKQKPFVVTKGRNLRAGAGLSARVLTKTTKVVTAELLVDSHWYKDGYFWSRIKIGNKKYYIAMM